jgi:hypothetical protein
LAFYDDVKSSSKQAKTYNLRENAIDTCELPLDGSFEDLLVLDLVCVVYSSLSLKSFVKHSQLLTGRHR